MALADVTSAASSLGGLLVVNPQQTVGYQPQNAPNNDGTPSTLPAQSPLLFHYEGEQKVTLRSDITDHYIEDNTAIQDNIALPPPTIMTHGYIGELNDIAPVGLQTLQVLATKLTGVGSYAPSLSATALLAYNEAAFLYQTALNLAASAVSALGSITGSSGESVIGATLVKAPNQNKQQTMFQAFYGYWQSRTLFTVQTPWAVFKNMAIENCTPIQDESTNVITSFEVTFKQIRYASDLAVGPGTGLTILTSDLVDQGQVSVGNSVPFSTTQQGITG